MAELGCYDWNHAANKIFTSKLSQKKLPTPAVGYNKLSLDFWINQINWMDYAHKIIPTSVSQWIRGVKQQGPARRKWLKPFRELLRGKLQWLGWIFQALEKLSSVWKKELFVLEEKAACQGRRDSPFLNKRVSEWNLSQASDAMRVF
jgi:hypothetical protein